jgi:hypothetical protein
LDKKCVFLFPLQLLSETFFILRRTESNMITDFRKILKYQISSKSVH